jgi:hypothetical protein
LVVLDLFHVSDLVNEDVFKESEMIHFKNVERRKERRKEWEENKNKLIGKEKKKEEK